MMIKDKRFIHVGQSNYWCELTGNGELIILLHGFTGSTNTWKSIMLQLQSSFQVLAIDLPGHGRTQVSTPKSMKECCQDLKIIIDQLGYDKVHLLGYSMGGRTALSFAVMYPELVHSLLLESASPGLEKKEDAEERVRKDQSLAERLMTHGLESFVDFWESIPLFDSQKLLPKSVQQTIRAERLSQRVEGLCMSLNHMGTGIQPSWWEKLESITIPVLLLAGEWDSKFINTNKVMHERLPNSELTVVKKSGHAIHVEQSEIFGKIVSEFFFRQKSTEYKEEEKI